MKLRELFPDSSSHDVALAFIQERFGDSQSVINKHYMELINIQPVTNDTVNLSKLYDQLERHMRSLEALHQDVNQDVLTAKLPKETLLQLETNGLSNKIRDLFKACVTARESTELQASDSEVNQHVQKHSSFDDNQ